MRGAPLRRDLRYASIEVDSGVFQKLACDLVFDNGRMMGTGFRTRHSLETILAANGCR